MRRDGVCIAVVNRFRGPTGRYKLGAALEDLGARWVPLELGTLSVVHHRGRPQVLAGGRPLDELGVDGVLWRVSENDTSACMPLLGALPGTAVLVNPLECIEVCSSKWATALVLARAQVPVLETVYVPEGGQVPELGDTVVLKPDRGAGGRGVRTARPGEVVPHSVLAQPWAGDCEGHRRVLVCGGRAVTSVVRRGAPGSLVNNLDAGGTAELVDLGDEVPVAEAASRAVGAVVAGVDVVDFQGRWQVLEVNSNPGIDAEAGAGGAEAVAAVVLEAVAEAARRAEPGGRHLGATAGR